MSELKHAGFVFNPKATAQERDEAQTPENPQMGLVPTWSNSQLKNFKECQYRTYLLRVKKMKDEGSTASNRGNELHEAAEDYIQAKRDDIDKNIAGKNGYFVKLLEELREGYAGGTVEVEGDWAFTLDWKQTGWTSEDAWARMKLDVMVHESETSGRCIDWKSGRKFGNELSHGKQGIVYAVGAFMRYPKLELLRVDFQYFDQEEESKKFFTRDQMKIFKPMVTREAYELTTAVDFFPNPSKQSCRWCPFAKDGRCEYSFFPKTEDPPEAKT